MVDDICHYIVLIKYSSQKIIKLFSNLIKLFMHIQSWHYTIFLFFIFLVNNMAQQDDKMQVPAKLGCDLKYT
jgi:hypothetical protein